MQEAKDLKQRLMSNILWLLLENTMQEVFDSIVVVKVFLERVGLFVIDKVRGVMVLHRSVEEDELEAGADIGRPSLESKPTKKKITAIGKDERHIEVPLAGIAGHIARSGSLINLADAHKSELFDRTMDDMTNFRTRQMLCVPCFESNVSNNVVGVMQIINCKEVSRPDLVDTEPVLAILREGEEEEEEENLYNENEYGVEFKQKQQQEEEGEGEEGDVVSDSDQQSPKREEEFSVDQVAFSKEDEILASIIRASSVASFKTSIRDRPLPSALPLAAQASLYV